MKWVDHSWLGAGCYIGLHIIGILVVLWRIPPWLPVSKRNQDPLIGHESSTIHQWLIATKRRKPSSGGGSPLSETSATVAAIQRQDDPISGCGFSIYLVHILGELSTIACFSLLFTPLLRLLVPDDILPHKLIVGTMRLECAIIALLAWMVLPTAITHQALAGLLKPTSGSTKFGRMLEVVVVFTSVILWSWLLAAAGSWLSVPMRSLTLRLVVARIGVLGVTLTSAMTGFGSAAIPLQYLGLYRTQVSEQTLKELEQTIRDMIVTRESLIDRVQEFRQDDFSSNYSSSVSHFPRSQSLTTQPRQRHIEFEPHPDRRWRAAASLKLDEVKEVETQLRNLTTIVEDLIHNYENLVTTSRRSAGGRAWRSFHLVMTIACTYRIIMATLNVFVGRAPDIEPATRMLSSFLQWLNIEINVPLWTTYIALAYIGFVLFNTLFQFFTRAQIMLAKMAGNANPQLMSLIWYQVKLLYFASSIILLRANLPGRARDPVTAILGDDLDFRKFHVQYDFVFVLSSMVGVLTAITHQQSLKAFA